MKKNKKIIFIIFILLAAGVLLGVFFVNNDNSNSIEQVTEKIQSKESLNAVTKNEVSQNISEEKTIPQEKINERADLTPYERQLERAKTSPLTKADIEHPLWNGSKERFKEFKVKITPDGYIPDAIIVEKGDSIQLNMFSDKDTDIESADFKFFSFIPGGKETNFGFLLNQEGIFTFYCKNQCLGKNRIFGHIVVRPRT